MPQSGLKAARWKAWGLRALALVLALLLFLISRQPISESPLVGVPVEYLNIPAGLELVGDVPLTVSVRVRGPRDAVRGLTPTQLAVEANLLGKTAGERMIQLRANNMNLPDGVQILRVEPLSLRLKLEATLRKQVKVEPQLTLADAGIDVTRVTLEPELIEIEGPASQVASVTSVKTESFSLKGHREPFTQSLEIELPHAGLRLVGNPKVRVGVALEARHSENKINNPDEVKVKR